MSEYPASLLVYLFYIHSIIQFVVKLSTDDRAELI